VGAPFQGRYPTSEVNDGTCPEKPDQLSAVSIAVSLRPIAEQSARWNTCYLDSIRWYQANKPDWTVQDQEVFASNFCNGGIPVKPGPGFQKAP